MDADHAEASLKFAEQARPQLRGLKSKAVLAELEQQYADLEVAMEWFIENHRSNQAFRLASSLVPFWMATKRLDDGAAWLNRALDLPGGDDVYRGRALFDAGYLAFWKGEDQISSTFQREALEFGRRLNNPTITALSLVGLARIALRTNVDEARTLCREALDVTEGTDDREGRSSAMHVLAVAAQMSGDLDEARALMKQRIELGRETGDLATISIESNNLSMVERQLGNFKDAEDLARQALDISSRRGDSLAMAWNLNGLAASIAQRGDHRRAATLIGAADAAMEAANAAWPPDELVHYNQTVSLLKEAMGSEEFERQHAAGHAMTTSEAVAFALGTADPSVPADK